MPEKCLITVLSLSATLCACTTVNVNPPAVNITQITPTVNCAHLARDLSNYDRHYLWRLGGTSDAYYLVHSKEETNVAIGNTLDVANEALFAKVKVSQYFANNHGPIVEQHWAIADGNNLFINDDNYQDQYIGAYMKVTRVNEDAYNAEEADAAFRRTYEMVFGTHGGKAFTDAINCSTPHTSYRMLSTITEASGSFKPAQIGHGGLDGVLSEDPDLGYTDPPLLTYRREAGDSTGDPWEHYKLPPNPSPSDGESRYLTLDKSAPTLAGYPGIPNFKGEVLRDNSPYYYHRVLEFEEPTNTANSSDPAVTCPRFDPRYPGQPPKLCEAPGNPDPIVECRLADDANYGDACDPCEPDSADPCDGA